MEHIQFDPSKGEKGKKREKGGKGKEIEKRPWNALSKVVASPLHQSCIVYRSDLSNTYPDLPPALP